MLDAQRQPRMPWQDVHLKVRVPIEAAKTVFVFGQQRRPQFGLIRAAQAGTEACALLSAATEERHRQAALPCLLGSRLMPIKAARKA